MPNSDASKPSLLLHICCAGCGVYVAKLLSAGFQIRLFFSNANLYPAAEYDKRLHEAKRIATHYQLAVSVSSDDHAAWRKLVAGRELDPERGQRCALCYRYRLEQTARQARALSLAYFATTLSISPHKDAILIRQIGAELGRTYGVKFYDQDFKKQDGYKKSCALARELGLYRQNYCGCEFSQRNLRTPE